jgi:hypothetical protein
MVNRIYESGVGDIRTRGKKTAMIVALIKNDNDCSTSKPLVVRFMPCGL